MIRLLADTDNIIKYRVVNSIDITGFTASLVVGGVTKTLSLVPNSENSISFSAEDIATIVPGRCFGLIIIKDGDGNLHQKMMPEFEVVKNMEGQGETSPVTNRLDSKEYQFFQIVIVAILTIDSAGGGGGGGGDEYVKKSAFANIENPKASVNSCQTVIKNILSAAKE